MDLRLGLRLSNTLSSGPPTEGLLDYFKSTDTIDISITDYDSVDPRLRSIFFIDETTVRPSADAYSLAIADILFNKSTLVGSEAKGIALYVYGTADSVLSSAALKLGGTYVSMDNLYSNISAVGVSNDGYEADAITGWSSTDVDVFESQAATVYNGTYAFSVNSNTTSVANSRIVEDMHDFCVPGINYTIGITARHVGTGGAWIAFFASTPNATYDPDSHSDNLLFKLDSSDVTYLPHILGIRHSDDTRYLIISEDSDTHDGGLYLDNMNVLLTPQFFVDIDSETNGDGTSWSTPWNSLTAMLTDTDHLPADVYIKQTDTILRDYIYDIDNNMQHKRLYFNAAGPISSDTDTSLNTGKIRWFGSIRKSVFQECTVDCPENTYYIDVAENELDSAFTSNHAANKMGVFYSEDDFETITSLVGANTYTKANCTSGKYFYDPAGGDFGRIYFNIGAPPSGDIEITDNGQNFEVGYKTEVYNLDSKFAGYNFFNGDCWGYKIVNCISSHATAVGIVSNPNPGRSSQQNYQDVEAYSYIDRCKIYDNGNTGVQIGGNANGARLQHNLIYDNANYGLHILSKNSVFANRIYNNIVYSNASYGYAIEQTGSTVYVIAQNNIGLDNGNADYRASVSANIQLTADHNATSGTGEYSGNWTYDAATDVVSGLTFESLANRDFRPTAISTSIDAGIAVDGITVDFLENPIVGTPDIGPYEYQGE